MSEKLTFYSNGKILLTGEYFVLFGARALAFPVVYGQKMEVEEQDVNQIIAWRAYEPDGLWFNVDYKISDLSIIDTSSMEQALYLQKILRQVKVMNPGFFGKFYGLSISTTVDFPVKWGLGTSSTLINNLADWAGIDVFELFYSVSKGSGFDVACAKSNSPIVFQRNVNGSPIIQQANFDKSFSDKLFLVYSGNKKSTEQHIIQFLQRHHGMKNELKRISHITDEIVEEETLEGFMELIHEHEKIVGSMLDIPPVQFDKFTFFKGTIKSLGAWGGDYYLAATTEDADYVSNYFGQFGLPAILSFKNIILK